MKIKTNRTIKNCTGYFWSKGHSVELRAGGMEKVGLIWALAEKADGSGGR